MIYQYYSFNFFLADRYPLEGVSALRKIITCYISVCRATHEKARGSENCYKKKKNLNYKCVISKNNLFHQI